MSDHPEQRMLVQQGVGQDPDPAWRGKTPSRTLVPWPVAWELGQLALLRIPEHLPPPWYRPFPQQASSTTFPRIQESSRNASCLSQLFRTSRIIHRSKREPFLFRKWRRLTWGLLKKSASLLIRPRILLVSMGLFQTKGTKLVVRFSGEPTCRK